MGIDVFLNKTFCMCSYCVWLPAVIDTPLKCFLNPNCKEAVDTFVVYKLVPCNCNLWLVLHLCPFLRCINDTSQKPSLISNHNSSSLMSFFNIWIYWLQLFNGRWNADFKISVDMYLLVAVTGFLKSMTKHFYWYLPGRERNNRSKACSSGLFCPQCSYITTDNLCA
jgi:hypothetical protein